VNVGAIPAELRDLDRWVVWRWEPDPEDPEKRRKPPYSPHAPDRYASSTDSTTWGTFEQAVAVVEAGRADGIGFALEPPYVGVDIDDKLPEVEQHAILLALDSYSERSASGTGHHAVLRGDLNGRGKHPAGFGVFQTDRFFYFTGDTDLDLGLPETIEERQIELEMVLAQYLPAMPAQERVASRPVVAVDLDDRDLLGQARAAKHGSAFDLLYQGNIAGYDSRSEADLALCSKLAFWTGRDPERIDRMFRASGLMRDKWERDDYRNRTIETAIEGCSEVYSRSRPTTPGLTRAPEPPESVKVPSGGSVFTDSLTPTYRVSESESLPPPAVGTDLDFGTVSESVESVPVSRPFAMPVSDFIALERPNVEPLLADADGRAVVGCHSLTLLGALGGHGKTTFFVDLALHLAAGVDYLIFKVPRPVSILMIENEGPEELFAEKLALRLATFPHELKARLDVCTLDWGGFSLAEENMRGRLANEVIENEYDLVFGDPLDSLGIAGVGSPEDTRNFLELMKQTGLHRSVAWWLNTHPRKEETKEALNEISGAWGGRPDAVLLLRMLDADRTQIRFPKLRWARRGKRATILLGFDPDTEAFTYLGEQSEEERDYLAETRALLGDGKWRTPKEIAAPKDADPAGIGANADTIKKLLERTPDVFESRTGEAAKEVGRSKQATVWQLRPSVPRGDEKLDAEFGGAEEPA
jgi:hypothetical protein